MADAPNNSPKISCLCITRNRVPLLKKSIRMFEAQTWPYKELVIVYLDIDTATKDFLSTMNNPDIKPVEAIYDQELMLGDLRNISIAESSGDYICTWDDDDWFHSERLRIQMEAIRYSGKKASAFLHLLMLDNTTQQAYISCRRLWEASMMCERKLVLDKGLVYPSVNQREDTFFLKKLSSWDAIIGIQNSKMYIYAYTGMNTCSAVHFKTLFSLGKPLSAANSELISHVYNQTEPDNTITKCLNAMKLQIS